MSAKSEQKSARKERNDRVMVMLGQGASVEQIVKETGLKKSAIYERRAKMRRLEGKSMAAEIPDVAPQPEEPAEVEQEDEPATPMPAAPPEVPPEVEEQDAPITPAEVSLERLIQAAYVAGVGLEEIAAAFEIDVAEIELEASTKQASIARKSQVLARLQADRPAQWLVWKTEQEAAAAKRAADKRIDKDRVIAFVGDVMTHQAGLLTESDMQLWIVWIEDLVKYRYPELA